MQIFSGPSTKRCYCCRKTLVSSGVFCLACFLHITLTNVTRISYHNCMLIFNHQAIVLVTTFYCINSSCSFLAREIKRQLINISLLIGLMFRSHLASVLSGYATPWNDPSLASETIDSFISYSLHMRLQICSANTFYWEFLMLRNWLLEIFI